MKKTLVILLVAFAAVVGVTVEPLSPEVLPQAASEATIETARSIANSFFFISKTSLDFLSFVL